MIAYSSMTVKEACDEVLSKISHFQSSMNLDYKTVWMFMNRARREVFARTLPFKDEAYIRSIDIANGQALPADFTRPLRVILRDTGTPGSEFAEARKAFPKEYWTVTNAARPHSFNQATAQFPVYTIWGNLNNPNDDRTFIYLSPTVLTGKLEYYAEYADLPSTVQGDPIDTAPLNVPYEFESLVIDVTLLRCYAKVAEQEKLTETFMRVQREYSELLSTYAAKRQTEAINQKALLNPEPSQTISTVQPIR